ncbi:MAG: SDR family oxidoreductase [Bacteroidetes bacterium]|nr:SDR family oxidoreductase [Bacteroidota bacterium]
MNKSGLHNLTVLITGASSGIGRACAIEASERGANCILVGRNEVELQKTKQLCSRPSVIVTGDLTNEQAIEEIINQSPKINGVVHCAGIINPRPIKFLKPESIKEIFDINFNAPVMLTSKLLQKGKIEDGASFVFISSISSQHPYFGGSMYVSSKAALEAFSKTLAIEVAPKKMRSNVLLPGLVKTQMLEETKLAAGEENFSSYEKQYPLGFGEPEDIAHAVCFLLSSDARWITGSELKMDGGLILSSKK